MVRRLTTTLAAPALVAAIWLGCGSARPSAATAKLVTHRAQLVGGDRALGDVGDYVLQNEKVRVIVQKPGFSRGFGVYGGSLIDADLRRPAEEGTSGAPRGNDQFGELFPAFFVQAVNVKSVFVAADGADGGPARLTAQGEAGDFLELAAILNRAVTGSNIDFQSLSSAPRLRYSTTYELEPGKSWVNVRFAVKNISAEGLKFPSDFAVQLLGLVGLSSAGFTVPVGDIALFGATSHVFMPGIGFDSRFGLEESYQRKVDFPAFPGIVTEWVASRGEGASYGLVVDESDRNFVWQKKKIYDDGSAPVTRSSILVPFSASSFLGLFYESAPPELAPGETFETVKHFVIGSGDVGSVLDGILELRGTPRGRFSGRVLDAPTGLPSRGTSVVVYQRLDTYDRIYSQYDVRADGSFGGTLPAGKYGALVQGDGRAATSLVPFEIEVGKATPLLFTSAPPGRVVVRVVDASGASLPAKVTAVGTYGPEHVGKLPRKFLFDLQAGDKLRATDLVDDDANDPSTRQYIESIAFTKAGDAELALRPGRYRIVSSRGPEYDLAQTEIEVGPAETRSVTHKLTRVVDTSGWIAGDLHIHSRNSIDSSLTLDERVRSLAAEGVEWAVSTDHNYVTDYRPYVAENDLFPWLFPMTGVEMTTLESGHFNGYPLRYEVGPVTHGAFAWAARPPRAVFDDMRALGSLGPQRTIIQVNHPRDGVLGYFAQYNRDPFTGVETPATLVQQVVAPKGPAFKDKDGNSVYSDAFDAIEIANGKLYWEIHHFRVPAGLPAGPLPAEIPETGRIVRKANGQPGYPGAVEDWFNLLNLGHRTVAVGTGDSHSGTDEAGQFRTMVHVGDDRPIALSEEKLVDAFMRRRVVVTNAPLVDFWVDDPTRGAMGQTIRARSAKVKLGFRLTAAPWVSVSHVNVWRNGLLAKQLPVDPSRNLAREPLAEELEVELAGKPSEPADTWFVVEAIGERSLFPVVRPHEVPPVLLTEAVAVLAGPLGLGADELGALKPPDVFPVTAYAITNPVWVTTSDAPFRAPGVVPVEVLDRPENDPKMFQYAYPRSTVKALRVRALSHPSDRFEPRGRVPLFYPRNDNPEDVRKVLSRFGHAGGHVD